MVSRIRAFALSFILLCSLSACEKPEEKEARYLKEGNVLFERGEFAKARLQYKNAAQVMPNSPEARYRLGLVDEAQNDPRNAFANFIAAEQQDKHYRPALLKLANYFLVVGAYDEADHRLTVVLGEHPDDAEGHALRAAILLRRKEFDGTEKEARKALALDSGNITAVSVLTGLYAAQKNQHKAEEVLEEGLKRNPGELSLLLLRATLMEQGSDLTKTVEAYRALFKAKPEAEMFRADLAKIYMKAGKKPEAEATLREGVAAMPENWAMKKELVDFLNKNGGVDIAEREIHGLMQAYPKQDDLYFWLADLYIAHNDTDRAQKLLEQIVSREQTDNTSLNANTSLARIHFVKGDRALAARLVEAVLKKNGGNLDALFIRAEMSFNEARYEDAVADLRAIIRDNPKALPAYQLLAEIFLIQNHLDLAIDTQTQLAEADPANPAPATRLAQMLLINKNEKRALEILENTTKLAPTFPIGWEGLARASITTHHWEKAEFAINKLEPMEGQHLLAQFLKAELLTAKGKRDEAITYYITVFTADPTTPLAERALSDYATAKQGMSQLADAAQTLMSLKADTPFLSTLIGGCLLKLGRTAEAAAAFDKALANHPLTQDAYLGRAKILEGEKKYDEALALLKTAQEKIPADTRAPMLAAELLGKLSRYNEAVALYSAVLEQSNGNDIAANNMAQMIADHLYTDTALLNKARQVAERFAGSTNPYYIDTLAWVYFRLGNYQQAQIIMERAFAGSAAEQLPPESHYHYGSILLKLNKTAEANIELLKAVQSKVEYTGKDNAEKLLKALP